MKKSSIKVLLLEGVHQSAVNCFTEHGYENVELLPVALSGDELIEKLKDASFVGIRSNTKLTREVLEKAPKLKAIGCFCIGTNQVDLEAAAELGIPVFNAPFSNTRSVAELVLGLSIMLMRGIAEKNAKAHRGVWEKLANGSHEVRGKKLGIVGYGNIGSQLSVLASGLGMHVYYYDIEKKLVHGNAKPCASLNELLQISDIVTMHVPATADTKMMMKKEQFDQMKEGAVFLNYARGNVVDIDALYGALSSKKLRGAAIDVFPVEPKSNKDPFTSPLQEFENVILTPHVGGSTLEAQENIGIEVAEKIIMYSDNGSTKSAVNFPEVSLPLQKNGHRILHVHQNRPGMLSQINQIFSEKKINILGQFLQTKGNVGYVVVDIDEGGYDENVLHQLKEIEGTQQVRVLF